MQDYGYNINSLISDMECFAKRENIPIMLSSGIEYLEEFIKKNNIKSTLEIGTAIGYSAIRMRLSGTSVKSIERDVVRHEKAKEYVEASKLDNISLVLGDALLIEEEGLYDLIFIDAAKAQNIKFIEKYKKNLKKDGYFIIDNVDFHGLVGKSEEIKSRNLRGLVRKIEAFLSYLSEQDEFSVTKVSVGDGLIILRRK